MSEEKIYLTMRRKCLAPIGLVDAIGRHGLTTEYYVLMLFLKTTVRNNVFVLDFIVYYLLHVSAPICGHLQVIHKIY
jgi:hypothetical protein